MKLFQKYDKCEGTKYPKNVFFVFGKYQVNSRKDGWYLKLELPLTRSRLHTNPITFEEEIGPMRYSIIYRCRPANKCRSAERYWIKGWFPHRNFD